MSTLESIRQPAVAGRFYTAVPARLRAEITGYLATPAAPKAKAYGVMVPHAGYVYSGAVCGRALASVDIPPVCLLLHTKHHLGGGALSLAQFQTWQTPLGPIETDGSLNKALASVPGVSASNVPHFLEHAAEVVLPFLQVLRPDVRIAVVSVSTSPLELLQRTAQGIAKAVVAHDQDVLLIASTDMNHYADEESTILKDKLALAALADFDAAAMLQVCQQQDISMCGAHATALMLETCQRLGATRVEVLEHTTSGAVSGDRDEVVGYASARVL
ncbi:MAG: AmmeMemoRadiSam system protein B [Planctomycetes bacterium]|nr:AmmeMemoRadiSam system protein B [Planctomycetota bacterium]